MSRALTASRHRAFHAAPFLPNLNIKRRCHRALSLRHYRLTSTVFGTQRQTDRRGERAREKEMKDIWENRGDRWRERQPGRGGRIVGVVVMAMAQVGDQDRGGVLLKVAVPVFEARLIKTLVQYLRWRGRGGRRGGEREKWDRARL